MGGLRKKCDGDLKLILAEPVEAVDVSAEAGDKDREREGRETEEIIGERRKLTGLSA